MSRDDSTDLKALRRFWAKVRKTDTCWLWEGTVGGTGRGRIGWDGHTGICVVRISWKLAGHSLEDAQMVRQRCGNPACVNPDHLYVPTYEESFWMKVARVEDENSCWDWQGATQAKGYGVCYVGVKMLAHRAAWEFSNGPIPEGKIVCHICDRPVCCRPSHLFLGTQADNIADAVGKRRLATGSRHGSQTHPERLRKGETSHLAILTEDAVRSIRRRYAAGGVFLRELAAEHHVTAAAIQHIVRRTTWAHVSD